MKKCSTSLSIKEMKIKNILGIYLTQARMAIIKKTTTNFGGEKKKPLYTVDGNVN
jgi:hypothetical protein